MASESDSRRGEKTDDSVTFRCYKDEKAEWVKHLPRRGITIASIVRSFLNSQVELKKKESSK